MHPEGEFIQPLHSPYPLRQPFTVTNQPLAVHALNSQTIPVTTLPQSSDLLPVFMSEARTHNSEVRMAVSKVLDKVDQLSSKVSFLLFFVSYSTDF